MSEYASFLPEESVVVSEKSAVSEVAAIYEAVAPLAAAKRIKEDDADFLEIYDANVIATDQQSVRERQAEYMQNDTPEDRERKMLADIMEWLVVEIIESDADIFGDQLDANGQEHPELSFQQARAFLASEYDDLFKGVDVIFQPGGLDTSTDRLVGLSFDATFNKSYDALRRKNWDLDRILERKRFNVIKYCKTDSFVGVARNNIREMVAFSHERTKSLARKLTLGQSEKRHSVAQAHFEAEKQRETEELGQLILTQLFTESYVMAAIARQKWLDDGSPKSGNSAVNYRLEKAANDYFTKALLKKAIHAFAQSDLDPMVKVARYLRSLPYDEQAQAVLAYHLYQLQSYCPMFMKRP